MRDPRTLLERIATPTPPAWGERRLLEESIRLNLSELFTSQRGCARAEPEYGLPDGAMLVRSMGANPSDEIVQPDVELFKQQLRRAIERFEPRLRVSQVLARVERGAQVHFEVRATIVEHGRTLSEFQATAQLQPSGHMQLT